MEQVFTDRHIQGAVQPYLASHGFQTATSGMSIMAMPPGKVDIEFSIEKPTVNVGILGSLNDICLLNGEKRNLATTKPNGVTFFGGSSDLALDCENIGWELAIEFDRDAIGRYLEEHLGDVDLEQIDLAGGADPKAAVLAQFALEHLREPIVDRLYLEGLMAAITARTLNFAAPKRQAPSTKGTDDRINRAIEYISDNLAKGMSITELASVACMSQSWFSRAFKAQTGKSVHAFVLQRRLDGARIALVTTKESISNVAYAYGFADHSHFTRLFKRCYGFAPRELR